MHRPLEELAEEFCTYQGKVSGKTEGGVRAYRWTLQQFLKFVQTTEGRAATVDELTPARVRAWMASMATQDLALSTMRVRQSTLSSFCLWLVKRDLLATNPVEKLDRPPGHRNQCQTRWARVVKDLNGAGYVDHGGAAACSLPRPPIRSSPQAP
jgi:site-specific recombinase XerC